MLKSPWLIAVLCLVVVGLVWFFLKGGKRLAQWLREPVEPDKPRWTYALTPLAAALAPLAAFAALLPSYLNQQQSDRKFMAEAGRSRTDAEWQRNRLDTETWAAQFAEVQTRVGSPTPQVRAAAALQLADLALLPKPTAPSAVFDDSGYPYFALTATQLAVALQMEPNPDVRTALGLALRKLIVFAHEKKNTTWQIGLANQLADTNRHARQALVQSLARYSAANTTPYTPTLSVLSGVAAFTAQPDPTRIALKDLLATNQFQVDKRIATRLRDVSTVEQQRTAYSVLLADVQARAAHLVDSREVLTSALRALTPASESGAAPGAPVPSLPLSVGSLPTLPTKPAPEALVLTLQLRDCFLAGADLRSAALRGADVANANFSGADLTGADVTGANLEAALHVPASVTKATLGPNSKSFQALKAKYPQYDWAATESQASPAGPPATSPASPAPGNVP